MSQTLTTFESEHLGLVVSFIIIQQIIFESSMMFNMIIMVKKLQLLDQMVILTFLIVHLMSRKRFKT